MMASLRWANGVLEADGTGITVTGGAGPARRLYYSDLVRVYSDEADAGSWVALQSHTGLESFEHHEPSDSIGGFAAFLRSQGVKVEERDWKAAALQRERAQFLDVHIGNSRARWAVGALVVAIVAALVGIGADVTRLMIAGRLLAGESVSLDSANASDTFVRVASICTFVFWALAFIAFLIWLYQAAANGRRLGAHELRFSPGWAVGWFFVPFADFVRPVQVVREIWRASDPSSDSSTQSGRSNLPVSWLIPVWWGLLLVSYVAGRLIEPAFTNVRTAADLRNLTIFDMVELVAFIATLLAMVLIVSKIHARQHAKATGSSSEAGLP